MALSQVILGRTANPQIPSFAEAGLRGLAQGRQYRESMDRQRLAEQQAIEQKRQFGESFGLRERSLALQQERSQISPDKQKTGSYLVKGPTGQFEIVTGVFDPKSGSLTTSAGQLPDGYTPVSKLGETGQEETIRKVGEVEKKEVVKSKEKRIGELIDRGVLAAESTATMRRGISLLNEIKTGGFGSVALKAKNLFGIESANEGELTNSLGKAVLSQLRETFGAAFTEEEGKRLERIEQNIGKSTESNKRLLSQALKIAERTSRRAIKAAERRGDTETAEDIKSLLDFSLELPPTGELSGEKVKKSGTTQKVLNFDAQGNLIK